MTDSAVKFDAVVVGAGHNGLVCAAYLARAGLRVIVLEARDDFGGAATTEEFVEGFKISSCSQWLNKLHPEIIKDLQLEKHGLKILARDLDTVSLSEDGNNLLLGERGLEGGDISEADRLAYDGFNRQMKKFARLLANAFDARAPKIVDSNLKDRITLLKLAMRMKLLGKSDMAELLRVALMNIYDVMEEKFDSEQLKAAISIDGILGTHMGPRSPNTLFVYLYHKLSEVYGYKGPAVVEGGMGRVGDALAASARNSGVELRAGSRVAKIETERGRVIGVRLSGGEIIQSGLVVSNADPKTTFETLVGYRNVEAGVVRKVSNIRMKGNTAKLHLALSALPDFSGVSEQQLGQRLIIAPHMKQIDQAFNAAKYAEYSTEPVMDISIPSIHDDSLAEGNGQVLSAIVQFAPYDLKEGWDNAKDSFLNLLIDQLECYAPGIKSLIIGKQLLTPVDLAEKFNLSGGHWHHGEISVDQMLMMRPFPGAAQYAMPVDGLFLCGAGAHPGGGVMGLAGRNAAREIEHYKATSKTENRADSKETDQ